MLFICYPKCSTCQKARKHLDALGAEYELRDIKLENPTRDELAQWQSRSGLPLRRFFNTSGMLYRELDLKNRLPEMSEDDMLELLASNGMLVKRPILVTDSGVLVGYRQAEYEKAVQS